MLCILRQRFFDCRRIFEMRGLAQGHVANNLQRETFQSCNFGGMVRQQLYTTQAQVMKYLRANAVIAIHAVTRFQTRLALAELTFPASRA